MTRGGLLQRRTLLVVVGSLKPAGEATSSEIWWDESIGYNQGEGVLMARLIESKTDIPLPRKRSSASWNLSLGRSERTVEDRLREEYFDLLPVIRRVADELESEIKHCLVPISLRLDEYERLVVTSRVKECESALDSVRRRQEGATFDSGRSERYSLTS